MRLDKVTSNIFQDDSDLLNVGLLAYKLEHLDNMTVHDVVSVAHLGPATNSVRDPYQRRRPPWLAIIIGGEDEYRRT